MTAVCGCGASTHTFHGFQFTLLALLRDISPWLNMKPPRLKLYKHPELVPCLGMIILWKHNCNISLPAIYNDLLHPTLGNVYTPSVKRCPDFQWYTSMV